MIRYLLDTSVYSQPMRRKRVDAALERWRAAGDADCAISMVSVAEIEWGLHCEGRDERWARYRALLVGRLMVLETSPEVWSAFAKIKARQQKMGQPVADLDLLIAATAVCHGLTVGTLNSADFSRIEGLAWENWAE